MKPGLELEIIPILADNPPAKVGAGPVVVEEFGKKYEVFITDLTLAKWTANFPPLAAASEELTKEQFVEGLRNGTSHEFLAEEVRKCPVCLGFGRISDDRPEGREKDGKRLCPQCAGKKEVLHKITYEVVWER